MIKSKSDFQLAFQSFQKCHEWKYDNHNNDNNNDNEESKMIDKINSIYGPSQTLLHGMEYIINKIMMTMKSTKNVQRNEINVENTCTPTTSDITTTMNSATSNNQHSSFTSSSHGFYSISSSTTTTTTTTTTSTTSSTPSSSTCTSVISHHHSSHKRNGRSRKRKSLNQLSKADIITNTISNIMNDSKDKSNEEVNVLKTYHCKKNNDDDDDDDDDDKNEKTLPCIHICCTLDTPSPTMLTSDLNHSIYNNIDKEVEEDHLQPPLLLPSSSLTKRKQQTTHCDEKILFYTPQLQQQEEKHCDKKVVITKQRNESGGRVRYNDTNASMFISSSSSRKKRRKRQEQKYSCRNKHDVHNDKSRSSFIYSWENQIFQNLNDNDDNKSCSLKEKKDNDKEERISCYTSSAHNDPTYNNRCSTTCGNNNNVTALLDDFAFHSQSSQPLGY